MLDTTPVVDVAPIEKIVVAEGRARKEFGDSKKSEEGTSMEGLVRSIKEEGLICPLAVTRDGDSFVLLAGERRLKASKMAELTEVPIRIYHPAEGSDFDELDMKVIERSENFYRKNLTWQEEVMLQKEVHDLYVAKYGEAMRGPQAKEGDQPWSKAKTAELFGQDKSNVSKNLKLANALLKDPDLAKVKSRPEANKKLRDQERKKLEEELAKRVVAKQAKTPIDMARRKLIDAYIQGDFFEGVKNIPDGTIDLIEIDPPYGIDLQSIKKRKLYSEAYSTDLADDYQEVQVDDYVLFLQRTVEEAYRVARAGAWLIFWFGPDPWFQTVHETILSAGWLGSAIPGIWAKHGTGQTMNPTFHLGRSYEMFFYARKGPAALNKPGRANVFSYTPVPPSEKIHPTERPMGLMRDLLFTFSGPSAHLLCPFLGSGNTLLAAADLGISGLGFDLSPVFRNSYISRVSDWTPENQGVIKDAIST